MRFIAVYSWGHVGWAGLPLVTWTCHLVCACLSHLVAYSLMPPPLGWSGLSSGTPDRTESLCAAWAAHGAVRLVPHNMKNAILLSMHVYM